MDNGSLKVRGGTAPGAGVSAAGTMPKEERKLLHLFAVINNTIERNHEAINRYRIMNDGLIGCGPENAAVEGPRDSPNGLIYELIERAEYLHDLCSDFDNQNNRLNQIIIDG